METKDQEMYKKIHLISKTIVFLINTVLLYVIVLFGTNLHLVLSILVFYNCTYFFGVNTIAFIIETILKVKHQHNKF
jgi:uncharacterized membrane protein